MLVEMNYKGLLQGQLIQYHYFLLQLRQGGRARPLVKFTKEVARSVCSCKANNFVHQPVHTES